MRRESIPAAVVDTSRVDTNRVDTSRSRSAYRMSESEPIASSNSNSSSGDPGRTYGTQDPKCRNNFTCHFCGKVVKGGVYRLKWHFIGGLSAVTSCPNCSEHVKEEIKSYMQKKEVAKVENLMNSSYLHSDDHDLGEEDDDCVEIEGGSGKVPTRKRPRQKGPLDRFFTPNFEDVIKGKKDGKGGIQQTINAVVRKELRDKACTQIARWFYDADIPFNAATYDSFSVMIEAIGQFGPGMKPPSMYELRVLLLNQEVKTVEEEVKEHKKEWAQKGGSILSDGWRDSVVQKDIINFMVNSPRGKMLEATRKHLYWTPCAAHCIDLMLEDIGKQIPQMKSCLKKAMFANGYIYNFVGLVNLMRKFTNQRNLHRPAITRFATSFITLLQFHKQKNNLRKMVASQEWMDSKWSSEPKGKMLHSYILQEMFWRNIVYALKLTGPLVSVLRLVDGERKPTMGYIYEAMDKAKEAIAKSFPNQEDLYKKTFEIIDNWWECQLHRPLHAVGHYLNPSTFYDNAQRVVSCEEVMEGRAFGAYKTPHFTRASRGSRRVNDDGSGPSRARSARGKEHAL
ncbi:uncharacterized protein LOC112524943 [Cynara cardunculus var. scolymus]|uniref:uncharacterized protein LOC112524943 n=1 Tax=Cynara cardunculus var. scolymus TaxID=59895 RepID=UPI000D6249AD|nr:uncharacterized protein LOC112524943 [Cynara cardunculus var. scolymus]